MPHLAAVPTWQPSQQDRQREARLVNLAVQFGGTKDREQRHSIWNEIKRLRAQRSPEFIRHMEREQGIFSD